MSMFTMCPSCGSDWCVNCECVKDKVKAYAKKLRGGAQFIITVPDDSNEQSKEYAKRSIEVQRIRELDWLQIADELDELIK